MNLYKDKRELIYYLEEDAKNAGISLSYVQRIKRIISPSYCYKYICILRYTSFYRGKRGANKIISKLLNLYLSRLALKLGFYIPEDIFGPGLYIPHFGSIVINPNATIGKNCQINNNVVIGQVRGKCPRIGDNVYIGPGAVVSGDVQIADNVWIGANAVVTKNVEEPYSFVCGVPAKIIGFKPRNWVEEYEYRNISEFE